MILSQSQQHITLVIDIKIRHPFYHLSIYFSTQFCTLIPSLQRINVEDQNGVFVFVALLCVFPPAALLF